MFALGVYAVFVVISIVGQISTEKKLRKALADTTPETIGGLIGEVRELPDYQGGYSKDMLLFYLLLQDAWYHPESATDNLKEMIEIGPDQFWKNEGAREDLGPEVAFTYYYAGLPSKVLEWNQQMLIEVPYVRPRAKFIEVASLLSLDRLDEARRLIRDELASTENASRTKLFAFLSYVMLEDYRTAAEIEIEQRMIGQMDSNQRWAWATYLLYEGKFEAAYQQFRQLNDRPEEFPDRAFEQALARAAIKGLDDLEVEVLLEQAAASTRNPRSIAGQQAMICSILLETVQDPQWADLLAEKFYANPDDFWVAAAQFEAAMAFQQEDMQFSGDHPEVLIEPMTVAGRRCLRLAGSEHERQWANLLMARALAFVALNPLEPAADESGREGTEPGRTPAEQPVELGQPPEVLLEQSAVYLRQALGDTNTPEPVESERLPDYDYFLLEQCVLTARNQYPQYDTAIHSAVIAYLERRAKLFEALVGPVELEPAANEPGVSGAN